MSLARIERLTREALGEQHACELLHSVKETPTPAEIFVREVIAHSQPQLPTSQKILWSVAYVALVLAVASVLLAFPDNVYGILD